MVAKTDSGAHTEEMHLYVGGSADRTENKGYQDITLALTDKHSYSTSKQESADTWVELQEIDFGTKLVGQPVSNTDTHFR